MSDLTTSLIGKLLTSETRVGVGYRDAIHIAVTPMIVDNHIHPAWNGLRPGDDVCLKPGTNDTIIEATDAAYERDPSVPIIGVIDPFLELWDGEPHESNRRYDLRTGEVVWVFLRPTTTTDLRHVWRHPVLDAQIERNEELVLNEHELWLRQFAARWHFVYDDLLAVARRVATGADLSFDNFIVAQGRDLHRASELGEDHSLFWSHFEALTGMVVDPGVRERMGWSCSC